MVLKYFKQTRRSPLLLTPRQFYQLFGVLFVANVFVLALVIRGAAANRDVFDRIAEEAQVARVQALTTLADEARAQRKQAEEVSAPLPAGERTAVRVTMPPGWQWTGCRVDEGAIEVSLSPVNVR